MATDKNYCTVCQRDLVKSKFWASTSIVNKNGLMHICSDCLNNLFDEFYRKAKNLPESFIVDNFTVEFDTTTKHIIKKLCRYVDINYSNVAFDSACNHCTSHKNSGKKINKIFGVYKAKASGIIKVKYGGEACFDESDNIPELNSDSGSVTQLSVNDNLSYYEEKFGYGYSRDEYLAFERKYKKLTLGYNEKTALHTEQLISYIIHKCKSELAAANGDVTEAGKWDTMASNDATKAKLNVSQLSKSDITGGIDLIPQLVEAVEERASLIPIMPKLKAQPYDDADMILWGVVNKLRRLEDKPTVSYREIWGFYDDMMKEHFKTKGLTQAEIDHEIKLRYKPFKDLGEIYKEPLYSTDIEDIEDEDGDDNVIG